MLTRALGEYRPPLRYILSASGVYVRIRTASLDDYQNIMVTDN